LFVTQVTTGKAEPDAADCLALQTSTSSGPVPVSGCAGSGSRWEDGSPGDGRFSLRRKGLPPSAPPRGGGRGKHASREAPVQTGVILAVSFHCRCRARRIATK